MEISHLILLLIIGIGAGLLGAITGIGGGIIITPVLSLFFGVPLRQAIGTSLIAVITTSAASSSVHVQRHTADIKLGMILELSTAFGAAVTAYFAIFVNKSYVAIIFSLFMLYSAYTLGKRALSDRRENKPHTHHVPPYHAKNYPAGLAASLVAGAMSGLLGIGGGTIKVPVMYIFMGIPLLVATATSNFMIGVTAAASAFVYFRRGDVLVSLAAPIVVGVFAGSTFGARIAPRIKPQVVMWLLIVVMTYLAIQMIVKVHGGQLR